MPSELNRFTEAEQSYVLLLQVTGSKQGNNFILKLDNGVTVTLPENLFKQYALPSIEMCRLGTGVGAAIGYWAQHGADALCNKTIQ